MQRLHFTREHMGIYLQRSADRRDHQTDNKSDQRPLFERLGAHRHRLFEAQVQDQTDQREQKRQDIQPRRRHIFLLIDRLLHSAAAVRAHDRLIDQLTSALLTILHLFPSVHISEWRLTPRLYGITA